jgi:hypothetical protein
MSAIARIPIKVSERNGSALADITAAIKNADSIEDLKEARARVEAMKAWAKVHDLTKQLRLELLHIEVAALVRIVELGGAATLKPAEARAAEYLAAMNPVERVKFIDGNKTATTATGLCQSVWREDEIKRHRQQSVVLGRKMAEHPEPPPIYDEQAITLARRNSHGIAGVLAGIADEYMSDGEEFTIEEMAARIMEDSLPDDLQEDDVIRKGVSEVCREAVRRAPTLSIGDTVIPRFITARNGNNKYIRIPTMNATLAHLDDMIMMRESQIAQDQLAVERLQKIAKMLRDCPGGDNAEARIGALVASSISEGGAA